MKKEDLPLLCRRPLPSKRLRWSADDEGLVTLEVENTGWVNRLAQVFFHRPAVSYIHLDKVGSFVWSRMDGDATLSQLGEWVEAQFGEEAQPLYPRLCWYMRILDSYRLISWA